MTSGPTVRAEAGRALIRLGVLGWPVAHSRSPAMHNAALAADGLTGWRYSRLPAPPERFAEIVAALPAAGFRGVNVTIPHKSAALALATRASARARAIGAANTLLFEPGGGIEADNTDAPALIASLGSGPLPGSALVLGAGGSARSAVWALRRAGVPEVRVWNRTPERARRLAAELGAIAIAEPSGATAELLVNCTAVGLHGEDPFSRLPLGEDALAGAATVVDYVYASGGTRLIEAGAARGLRTVDGLELLVTQGALAYERFTDRPAPIEIMRDAARAAA